MMTRSLYVVAIALLGMAGFQATMTGIDRPVVPRAESAQERSSTGLDSRTIPHPDWVQVSGQIVETVTIQPEGQDNQLMAMLQPVEGGRIVVDLGPVDNLGSVRLENRDYIHVRGPALQHGNTKTIIAGELIADGKLIPIQRAPGQEPPATAQAAPQFEQMTPSPAAPPRQPGESP